MCAPEHFARALIAQLLELVLRLVKLYELCIQHIVAKSRYHSASGYAASRESCQSSHLQKSMLKFELGHIHVLHVSSTCPCKYD
jgi:hypothetical protein